MTLCRELTTPACSGSLRGARRRSGTPRAGDKKGLRKLERERIRTSPPMTRTPRRSSRTRPVVRVMADAESARPPTATVTKPKVRWNAPTDGFGRFGDLLNAFFGGGAFAGPPGGAGGGTWRSRVTSLVESRRRVKRKSPSRRVSCEHFSAKGAERAHRSRKCEERRGAGSCRRDAAPVGQMVRKITCAAWPRDGRRRTKPPGGRARSHGEHTPREVEIPGLPTGSESGGRARARGRRAPAAPCIVIVPSRDDG